MFARSSSEHRRYEKDHSEDKTFCRAPVAGINIVGDDGENTLKGDAG